MAKDKLRDRMRALGTRARALLGRVTEEEVQRAECDSDTYSGDLDTRAQQAAQEAIRRRKARGSD